MSGMDNTSVSESTVIAVLRQELDALRWQNTLLQARVIELTAELAQPAAQDQSGGPEESESTP